MVVDSSFTSLRDLALKHPEAVKVDALPTPPAHTQPNLSRIENE